MYDPQDEGLVRERLGIHQLLFERDHRLTLVYHLISSSYHPLLDWDEYRPNGEGLIGEGLGIHLFLEMQH